MLITHPIDMLALLEINPYTVEEPEQRQTLMERLEKPWEEFIGLEEPNKVLARALDLSKADAIIEAIIDNPIHEITGYDLFQFGNSSCVFFRIIVIHNTNDLYEACRGRIWHRGQEWRWGLMTFLKDEYGIFTINGHMFMKPAASKQAMLYWKPSVFCNYIHTNGVRRRHLYVEDGLIAYDGPNDMANGVNRTLEMVNYGNHEIFENNINLPWLVQQPIHFIEETYGQLITNYLILKESPEHA